MILARLTHGDTIIYESETQENKKKEEEGVKRILKMLPIDQGDEYLSLWYEFEEGKSDESVFARAVDRIPPLLHNLRGNGHSWRENNVSKEKILTLNSRIGNGTDEVWDVLKIQLHKAVEAGILK